MEEQESEGRCTRQETLDTVSIKYAGRLGYYYDNWTNLTSNPLLLEWIEGYRLPFIDTPNQLSPPRPPNFSSMEKCQIKTEIENLIKIGAISECEPMPHQFVSPIFLADKPNGKKRFILNLKSLNVFINAPHFKMEDIRTVGRLVRPHSYMASLDLKDAYYMLPICMDHKKYLRFDFEDRCYHFNCLCFGLSSAPYTFSKLMKPITQNLRSRGMISVNYLDDFFFIGSSFVECSNNLKYTISLLEKLGFIVNYEKSMVTPSKQCKFLGFQFDSESMTLELPFDKKQKILKFLKYFQFKTQCKIRTFAQLIGLLTSACPGVKYGWAHTKLLERAKYLALTKSNGHYSAKMQIPDDIRDDLAWWVRTLPFSKNDLTNDVYSMEISSDSSLSGWGAVCNGTTVHGWWTSGYSDKHINFLELQAIYFGLQTFAKSVQDCNILLRTDNTTALACVNKMGSVQHPTLNNLSREIWEWCEARNLWIFASYISSKDNYEADEASRILPPETEWTLNEHVFSTIVAELGYPEVDLFATSSNAKCETYVSWFREPGAWKVDAFTVSWSNLNFYAFPPFSLITRVLQKIMTDKATGIVVVPLWEGQVWYPLFMHLCTSNPLTFGPNDSLLISPFRNQTHHPLSKDLILVAAKLSGKHT